MGPSNGRDLGDNSIYLAFTRRSRSATDKILFLLAPLWINAFVYMTFARIAWLSLSDHRIGGIKPVSDCQLLRVGWYHHISHSSRGRHNGSSRRGREQRTDRP
ncbi:hypothetical protein F4819DRAFT_472772 [Hypoxylon fuscum]|nr:hypothetical protein F4819DRAFT_472772 [Hypoxylon fuscum]